MADKTIKDYKFLGIVLPNGIVSKEKPDEIILSVCLNINNLYKDFVVEDNKSKKDIAAQYDGFYTSLRHLQDFFDPKIGLAISKVGSAGPYIQFKDCIPSNHPFEYFNNESESSKEKVDYTAIKKSLWDLIFPEKGSTINGVSGSNAVNTESRIKNYKISNIGDILNKKSDIPHLEKYSLDQDEHIKNIKDFAKNGAPENNAGNINAMLNKINQFGKLSESIALKEKSQFITKYGTKLRKINDLNKNLVDDNYDRKSLEGRNEVLSFMAKTGEIITKYYVSMQNDEIDIDEVINNFSAISNEPVLMRLMGLIKDYKVTIPNYDGSLMPFFIRIGENDNVFSNPTSIFRSEITTINGKKKFAYFVSHHKSLPAYFGSSILYEEGSEVIRFDKVSKIQNLIDHAERFVKGENVESNDNKEALTRGLLYTHEHLSEIITPSDDINISTIITDDYVTRGHRVAVKITKKNKSENLFSLSSRSISLKLGKKRKPFYSCGNMEGCIHFDAPIAYMQDGEVKAASSDVLFEYSGELLKLKSAFSKANKINKSTRLADQAEFHHDDGLHKSIARFEKAISFFHFPFTEVQDKAYLHISYAIPDIFKQDYSPKLRFNSEYRFVVYQEYLNGWGLPLKTDTESIQISLEDKLLSKYSEAFMTKPKAFQPLENKKPLLLFHRKESHDEASKPMEERASLEHLIVRSETGDDSKQRIEERHVLPPKIELETAYWYGLLSKPKMDADKSFDIRLRSVCKFADKTEYDEYTNGENGIKRSCPEGCKSYCGGTHMEKYYSDEHITPRFLTDPTISGFSIKLFWDKECKIPLYIENKANFSGTAGIEPKSYLLRVKGTAKEVSIENHKTWEVMEVYLKKGMNIYAQLVNELNKDGKNYLVDGWWIDTDLTFKNNNLRDNFKNLSKSEQNLKFEEVITNRNTPKFISLTHAVKEPLITPEILSLFSTPSDHKKIEHINEWLKEKDYQHYKVEINVIANRIDKTTGNSNINSSFTKVELTSHFERLDAIRKIEFLKDIIPTGALELWMRKEEFIDNPDQIVLALKSDTNHIPTEPVVSFLNPKNIFNLDYKIEFSNEMMGQLKNLKSIEDIDSITDVFRSLITKLKLEYDFKTTKFEEREYYLKNISKFKGFFTDEKFINDEKSTASDKLEEYVLPKIKDVMKDLDETSRLRFKVMVLNNQQPVKPDVAYAVTTIQEKRTYPERKKTISVQKGNIVTIYLKRGRLSSGKDERVGIIVDADSLYNKLFKDNDLISKAGRDIVSDRYSNRNQYLKYGDIIIPEHNDFKAGYDNELGIYHFLPQFDIEKQLWKFEVELDIKTQDEDGNEKQLHNPFINFSIVHYQPFSINYNDKSSDAGLLELKNDCRISDVENSTWCYLLPERKLSVFFDTPGWFDDFGEVDLTVSFDHESLHHFSYYDEMEGKAKWKVRSNFIVTVQGSDDGIIWNPVNSKVDDGNPLANWEFHHALLNKKILENEENMASLKLKFRKWSNPSDVQTQFNEATQKNEPCEDNDYAYLDHSRKFSNFRFRFVEVEWFSNETWDDVLKSNEKLLTTDIVDNEEMRVRYVELIY